MFVGAREMGAARECSRARTSFGRHRRRWHSPHLGRKIEMRRVPGRDEATAEYTHIERKRREAGEAAF